VAETLEVTLQLDGRVFFLGDPVALSLRVRNPTDAPMTLTWPSAQRYDFVIEDHGRPVWVWSKGRAFAQVLIDHILSPHGEAIFREVWRTASPGHYRAQGILMSLPPRTSEWAEFEVVGAPME
jgi:hypothetical protein